MLKRVQRAAMTWSWASVALEGASERAVDRKLMAWSKQSSYMMEGRLRWLWWNSIVLEIRRDLVVESMTWKQQ